MNIYIRSSILVIFILTNCIPIYANQLKESSNNYYVVIGNNINVRESPDVKSKSLLQLPITTEVKVLKKNDKIEKIGDFEGHWLYVDTSIYGKQLGVTIKGWVFDYYLAKLSDFKLISSFKKTSIALSIGDWGLEINFLENGTFNGKVINSYENKIDNVKGKLYKLRNVIYAKYENIAGGEYFYIKNNNLLCYKYCCENKNPCSP